MIAIKLETDCKILHQQAKTLQTEIVVKLVASSHEEGGESEKKTNFLVIART